MNPLMATYIIGLYVLVISATMWGAFSVRFNANLLQRFALFGFSLWSVWRISLILDYGYSWPQEPVMVTALALYAMGTIKKTLDYKRKGYG